MKISIRVAAVLGLPLLVSCNGGSGIGAAPQLAAIGDAPIVGDHVEQSDAEAGLISTAELIEAGRELFVAPFNSLDGAGRPEATGAGAKRSRREAPENINRISSPEAESCAGCHNRPFIGGGGDITVNAFVMAEARPFLNFDGGEGDDFEDHTLQGVGNERATIGMFGSGYTELLAREMTAELHTIRDEAILQAALDGSPVVAPLVTKGTDFGSLTANPDGSVDTAGVEGIDEDLIVKPFHQKGVVISLREFSNNGMNHHHGIQSEERFGTDVDHDADGIANEVTIGDITAISLFQAALPVPGRVLPDDTDAQAAIVRGEAQFETIGCASCHTPSLTLDDATFSEPNPYNPPGTLQLADVGTIVSMDLTTEGLGLRLTPELDGTVTVPIYSDFKRHDMGAENAEALVQGGVPTSHFLTKRLWGFANEGPFMHAGRATTITDAIMMHGGEGQASRDAFDALTQVEKDEVIAFLKTLQVLPEDATTDTIVEPFSGIVGEEPAVIEHIDQTDIDNGVFSASELFDRGAHLFNAEFNTLDGFGRPEATGTGGARPRREGSESVNRISGPDAGSCAACHNLPRSGGGGESVTNVFVMAQRLPFVTFDGGAGDGFRPRTLKTVGNERATIGMFGSGFIELLAREITADLLTIRDDALAQAQSERRPIVAELMSKGVSFGSLVANPNGFVDTSGVEGIDTDLILKPFHQKGVVISLREFTNNAMNHHHGIQPSERFGAGIDHDADGIVDELTVGDITATTLYQAMLPVPGRVMPAMREYRLAVERGEELFAEVGCASCHVPALRLEDAVFTEPNPYNLIRNLQVGDVPQPFGVDLLTEGPGPHLVAESDGSVMVPAYTDLKRHDMGPENAEPLSQSGVSTSEFLTKKLWGFANEGPFMHHGRATTIDEAIRMHGGDATAVRDAYIALDDTDRDCIIDFLKTLQVVEEDEPLEVVR